MIIHRTHKIVVIVLVITVINVYHSIITLCIPTKFVLLTIYKFGAYNLMTSSSTSDVIKNGLWEGIICKLFCGKLMV